MQQEKNNVRRRRRQKGLKQKTLADMTGTAQSTISDIETGRAIPNVYLAMRIAQALETSVEQLFPLTGKETNGRNQKGDHSGDHRDRHERKP